MFGPVGLVCCIGAHAFLTTHSHLLVPAAAVAAIVRLLHPAVGVCLRLFALPISRWRRTHRYVCVWLAVSGRDALRQATGLDHTLPRKQTRPDQFTANTPNTMMLFVHRGTWHQQTLKLVKQPPTKQGVCVFKQTRKQTSNSESPVPCLVAAAAMTNQRLGSNRVDALLSSCHPFVSFLYCASLTKLLLLPRRACPIRVNAREHCTALDCRSHARLHNRDDKEARSSLMSVPPKR